MTTSSKQLAPPVVVELSAAEQSRKDEMRARLLKGQEKMRELRASGWKPPPRLNPVEAALAKPNSLKLAIRANCWVCVGGDADPGARYRVRDCGVGAKCPLFSHRPWQGILAGSTSDDGDEEVEAELDEQD